MQYVPRQSRSRGRGRGSRQAPLAAAGLALLCLTAGCHRPPAANQPEGPRTPEVKVTKPERKTVRYRIVQPGYNIQAFERTEVVSKIPGYVKKWNVDIGDRVKKGDTLAELSVPELVAEHQQKEEQVRQAEKALAVARAQVGTAKAQVREAEAGLARAEANRNYWRGQSERFSRLARGSGVIDKQSEEETANQFRSASAALKEAEARIESARAGRAEKEAARDKAQADVRAAEADERRVAALVGYTKLLAPYGGVVTERNRNLSTGQFVQPATGGKGDVLFVVEQTDTVRVFVNVPDREAVWVYDKAPAYVRVQGLKGQKFRGTVTRSSYAYDPRARTLRTEIDLPSAGGKLRPGMYVHATIVVEHKNVWALPASAVATEGEQTYCFRIEDGKAVRTRLQVGISGEEQVEVLKKQGKSTKPGEEGRWEDLTGDEKIIHSNVAGLKDGQAVQTASEKRG